MTRAAAGTAASTSSRTSSSSSIRQQRLRSDSTSAAGNASVAWSRNLSSSCRSESGRPRLPSDCSTNRLRIRPSASSTSMRAWSSVIDSSPTAVVRSRTRLTVRIVDRLVGVFLNAGLPAHQTDRGAVIDRELSLQASRDVLLIAEVHHERRHTQPHGLDTVWRRPVLVVKLNGAVDRRMIDDAARERLVRVRAQIEIDAEPRRDLRQIERGRLHRGEPARSLDAVLPGREPLLREQRRNVAVLRGSTGVECLAHRPEHLAQAGGLSRRQADRPHHLLDRQTEEAPNRRRRAKHAGRSGDVPSHVVVRRVDGIRHARFGLEAQDEGQHEVAAAHRIGARVRHQRRCHGRGGMAVVFRRRVVVVVHVRADAVHERRVQRIEPVGSPKNAGGRRARIGPKRPNGDVHGGMEAPPDGAPDVVHDRPSRLMTHIVGNVLEAARRDVRC